jgi:hypothetical protein
MRLYPAAGRPLAVTVAADLLLLLLLALFARLAFDVHDAVERLTPLGAGLEDAGGSVRRALHDVAAGVGSIPLVGGQLADRLRRAADATSGEAVAAGRDAQQQVHELARTLGWLTFAVPSLLALVQYLPLRIAQIRRLTAGARIAGAAAAAHPRLLAMRAAFSLPYATLAHHTSDPFGDLERGDYDALVAAAREDAGLGPAAPR